MGRKRQKNGCKAARQRRRQVGLNPYDEVQLKAKLRLTTPSEPWIEAQFRTVLDQDADRGPILYRYRDPHVFPPGGQQTRMIRCATCGIFNPPNAMEHGNCLDHADHRGCPNWAYTVCPYITSCPAPTAPNVKFRQTTAPASR